MRAVCSFIILATICSLANAVVAEDGGGMELLGTSLAEMAQLLGVFSALAARFLARRRRARAQRDASLRTRHIGAGSRPNKSNGTARRPWLKGLEAWRLRSKSRPSAYEVSFLNDAEYWKDDPDSILYKEFAAQFRVSYPLFEKLLELTKSSNRFRDIGDGVKGPAPHPLAIKLLACLRFLATGISFKALEVESGLSKSTISRFYSAWTAWLVEEQLDTWVYVPSKIEDI